MRKILFLLPAAFLLLVSCGLFYPPAFYESVVNGTNSSGSSGNVDWKTLAQYGVSCSAPSSLMLEMNSGGNPVVVSLNDTFSRFDVYNSSLQSYTYPGPLNSFSLALNSLGIPYIACNVTNGGFYYVSGGLQNHSTNIAQSNTLTTMSLVFDGSDVPSIAYSDSSGGYLAQYTGTSWSNYTITSNSIGSIQLNYSGSTYYLSYTTNSSLYARSAITIDSLAGTSDFFIDSNVSSFSMASGNGMANIIYRTNSSYTIMYKTFDGGTVNSKTSFVNTNYVTYSSIAADNAGNVYFAYSGGAVKVYRYSQAGNSWIQVGDVLSSSCYYTISLDLSPGSVPFIAYSEPLSPTNFTNSIIFIKAFQ
jgi:hypothetical protein